MPPAAPATVRMARGRGGHVAQPSSLASARADLLLQVGSSLPFCRTDHSIAGSLLEASHEVLSWQFLAMQGMAGRPASARARRHSVTTTKCQKTARRRTATSQ